MRVPGAPFQGRTSESSPPWQVSMAPAGRPRGGGRRGGGARGGLAAVGGGRGAGGPRGGAGGRGEGAPPADGRQRLAAEAQRGDTEEIIGVLELAGGVAGEHQGQIVRLDTAAVVHHPD